MNNRLRDEEEKMKDSKTNKRPRQMARVTQIRFDLFVQS